MSAIALVRAAAADTAGGHDGQRHDVVVDVLHAAADHDLEAVAGLRDRAQHAGIASTAVLSTLSPR
jgi:hypothetical protein